MVSRIKKLGKGVLSLSLALLIGASAGSLAFSAPQVSAAEISAVSVLSTNASTHQQRVAQLRKYFTKAKGYTDKSIETMIKIYDTFIKRGYSKQISSALVTIIDKASSHFDYKNKGLFGTAVLNSAMFTKFANLEGKSRYALDTQLEYIMLLLESEDRSLTPIIGSVNGEELTSSIKDIKKYEKFNEALDIFRLFAERFNPDYCATLGLQYQKDLLISEPVGAYKFLNLKSSASADTYKCIDYFITFIAPVEFQGYFCERVNEYKGATSVAYAKVKKSVDKLIEKYKDVGLTLGDKEELYINGESVMLNDNNLPTITLYWDTSASSSLDEEIARAVANLNKKYQGYYKSELKRRLTRGLSVNEFDTYAKLEKSLVSYDNVVSSVKTAQTALSFDVQGKDSRSVSNGAFISVPLSVVAGNGDKVLDLNDVGKAYVKAKTSNIFTNQKFNFVIGSNTSKVNNYSVFKTPNMTVEAYNIESGYRKSVRLSSTTGGVVELPVDIKVRNKKIQSTYNFRMSLYSSDSYNWVHTFYNSDKSLNTKPAKERTVTKTIYDEEGVWCKQLTNANFAKESASTMAKVWSEFKKLGYTEQATAGILGRMYTENKCKTVDLVAYNSANKSALKKAYGSASSLAVSQVNYIDSVLKKSSTWSGTKYSYSKLKKTSSVANATTMFDSGLKKIDTKKVSLSTAKNWSSKVYKILKSN